jgi:hypothetical protein
MVAITQIAAGLMTMSVAVQALPQNFMPSASPAAPAKPAATLSPEEKAKVFAGLLTAPTAIKRFQQLLTTGGESPELLKGDRLEAAIVFDFVKKSAKPPPTGNSSSNGTSGGVATAANIDTFPILTGLGLSTTVGFLEPCGINTPHVHPRATEFLTLVNGTNLKFGMVLENGLVKAGSNPEVSGKLSQFQGTVFPQGSIHYQFNDDCNIATFVANLNSEDPGTNQVAQGFFALDSQVVAAVLPKTINLGNIEEFRKNIPANLAKDVEICQKKCASGSGYPTSKGASKSY